MNLPELLAGEEEKTRWSSQTRLRVPHLGMHEHDRPKGYFIYRLLSFPPCRPHVYAQEDHHQPARVVVVVGPAAFVLLSLPRPPQQKQEEECLPGECSPRYEKVACAPVLNPKTNAGRFIHSSLFPKQ